MLKELALIGFSDMADYLRLEENGEIYLDFTDLPQGATRVIAEIVQDEYVEGRAEDARAVKRTRFKLHNKLTALESIAKHLGMYVQRHEHSGPGGGPIPTTGVLVVPGSQDEEEWALQAQRN